MSPSHAKSRKRDVLRRSLGWEYITPEGRDNLKHYQYAGSDLSYIYKYFCSPLAQWCVDHLTPTWLAYVYRLQWLM